MAQPTSLKQGAKTLINWVHNGFEKQGIFKIFLHKCPQGDDRKGLSTRAFKKMFASLFYFSIVKMSFPK